MKKLLQCAQCGKELRTMDCGNTVVEVFACYCQINEKQVLTRELNKYKKIVDFVKKYLNELV